MSIKGPIVKVSNGFRDFENEDVRIYWFRVSGFVAM